MILARVPFRVSRWNSISDIKSMFWVIHFLVLLHTLTLPSILKVSSPRLMFMYTIWVDKVMYDLCALEINPKDPLYPWSDFRGVRVTQVCLGWSSFSTERPLSWETPQRGQAEMLGHPKRISWFPRCWSLPCHRIWNESFTWIVVFLGVPW